MRTKPRVVKRIEHKVQADSDSSYNSDEKTDDNANDSYYTKEEKPKDEGGIGPLKCLDLRLYE